MKKQNKLLKSIIVILFIIAGFFIISLGSNHENGNFSQKVSKYLTKISPLNYFSKTFALNNEVCTCGHGNPINCSALGRCCKCNIAGDPYCDICSGPVPQPPPNPTPAPVNNCQVNMSSNASGNTITQGNSVRISWTTSGYGAAWAHGVSGGLFCCPQGADICSNISQCSSTNCGTCDNLLYPTQTTSYWITMECNCQSHVNCGASTGTITIYVNPAPAPTPAPPPPQPTPPPPGPTPYCGDHSCNDSENCSSCPGDCGTCPAPPPSCTATLGASASPNPIKEGQCSTISWLGLNLSHVTLWDGSIVLPIGSKSVCPTQTTSYRITGLASPGCTLANPIINVSVTVTPKAPTVTMTANPASISKGQSSTLNYNSTGATRLTINQNVGSVTVPSGSKSVAPSVTTTYMITATGPGGTATASATVTVTNPAAPTVNLTAKPPIINPTECSALNWDSTNATTLNIDNGVGSVNVPNGTKQVCPKETTTYTITATGQGGTTTKSATVTVNPCGAPCSAIEAEGIVKFDQNQNQYYLLKDDKSTVVLIEDPCVKINFKDYLDSRVKVTGCDEKSGIRVLHITKISNPVPPEPPKPSPIDSLKTLISTGGSLWLNIIISLLVSAIISFFVLRKKQPIY